MSDEYAQSLKIIIMKANFSRSILLAKRAVDRSISYGLQMHADVLHFVRFIQWAKYKIDRKKPVLMLPAFRIHLNWIYWSECWFGCNYSITYVCPAGLGLSSLALFASVRYLSSFIQYYCCFFGLLPLCWHDQQSHNNRLGRILIMWFFEFPFKHFSMRMCRKTSIRELMARVASLIAKQNI